MVTKLRVRKRMIHIRTRVSVPQIQNLDRSEASGGPRCRTFSPTSASSPVEPVRYTTDSRRRMAVYYGARNRPVEWVRLSWLTADSNRIILGR